MGNWVDVYDDDELWDGDMAGVTVGKEKVLIMRANEKLLAFKDACPHKGTPLSDGDLADGVLTCNDSLPQLSTDTPNAFCKVKPTRDTGLLSPAM